MTYQVTFSRSARVELERLEESLIERIFPKIEALAQTPRPHRCTKLEGTKNLWRIRIGDYRVIYSISDESLQVDVIAVKHRREVYR